MKISVVFSCARYEAPSTMLDSLEGLAVYYNGEVSTGDKADVIVRLDTNVELHPLVFRYIEAYFDIEKDMNCVKVTTLNSNGVVIGFTVATRSAVADETNAYVLTKVPSKAIENRVISSKQWLVSCIIPVYNVELYLVEAIESVISQSIGFEENVQLILVNDGSPDGCGAICEAYKAKYPENVVYIEQENCGVSAARNAGLDVASGEFVAFLDGCDRYDHKAFEKVTSLFEQWQEVDVIETATDEDTPLNYKYEQTRIVDTSESISFIQTSFKGVFIRLSVAENMRFEDSNFEDGVDVLFLHNLLLNNPKYGICSEVCVFTSETANEGEPDINWYADIVKLCYTLLERSQNRYTQYLSLYLLQWCNVREILGSEHNRELVNDTLKNFGAVIKQIDEDIIKSFGSFNYWKQFYLLNVKYSDLSINFGGESTPSVFLNGQRFASLQSIARIAVIEEYDGIISISVSCKLPLQEHLSLVAIYDNELFLPLRFDSDYEADFLLGEPVHKAYVFEFKIPYCNAGTIAFYLNVDGFGYIPVRLAYKSTARMCEKNGSYMIGDKSIISRSNVNNELSVQDFSFDVLRLAIDNFVKRNYKDNKYSADVALLNEYLSSYSMLSKRRIWLFMDRHNEADDNAEHFFRYCANENDGISKYFIVDSESPDYERLQRYGEVVAYGSNQHKLLYLFAEKNIWSNTFRHPFGTDAQWQLFAGLVKSKLVYLRHGIGNFDMSQILNRWTRNIKLFCTNVDSERNSIISNANYGYDNSIVKLTGLARFDNLYDDRQRKIVFMPSWRMELFPQGSMSKYNPDFKDSEYVSVISDLLTDEEFVGLIKNSGYELLFRPHSIIYPQINEIEIDEFVQIIDESVSYQDIFAEALLIITDYSSVMFDFAYLGKPVLYYQFNASLYKPRPFDYLNDGFGEVAYDKVKLISNLAKFLECDCSMQDKYKERADRFFTYRDKNNCARIYNAVLGMERAEVSAI